MFQWMINLLFNEKFVLFGIFVSILLTPVIGLECAKKKKKESKKRKKTQKEEDCDSESIKQKKKKARVKKKEVRKSKKDVEDDEDDSNSKSAKKKAVKVAKKPEEKRLENKPMNTGMPQQMNPEPRIYLPPPQYARPIHPGYQMPLEPTEDTDTIKQVEQFHDVPNF
ncbi:uncharacterized protein CELE_F26B1.1 [Caenorhabditis elegans]|uniref:Uncharacterized protein n=1 Tax=Caenorhabditis elegans TaxID=6239 RepID=C7FZT0_CAEEL|nr:Uncharacterized protein CELE_F26B1.1 [Caenorhabditis elegans]CCD64201.2 Uncharacterized protein CELE_F26B1.1 [Caenorhabditis elegans]